MPQIMLKTGAIVPAAGYSSRMGECKATMDIMGRPALEWIVSNLRSGGIDEITVVIGHWRRQIEPMAKSLGCDTIYNERYDEGMFSSVLKGLENLPKSWDRLLLLPVDIPLVRDTTIARIAAAETRFPVTYPTFLGERGHPPLIDREAIATITGWNGEMGLKGALALLEDYSGEIPVADRSILRDMDGPEDYLAISEMAEMMEIPTDREIYALERIYETPENVIRHERRVCETAMRMAELLNEAGFEVDVPLLRAAALLHDLRRTEKKHGRVGAETLRANGFDSVADLVEKHMDYPYDDVMDEGALLYIADKLTCGERLCSPQERLNGMLSKFEGRPEAQKNAARRLKKAKKMLRDFSGIIGKDGMEAIK